MKYLSRSLEMKMRKIFSKNSFLNNFSLWHIFWKNQITLFIIYSNYKHIYEARATIILGWMTEEGGWGDQHHQIYRVRAILASTPPELTIDNSQCFSLNPNTWWVKYMFFNPIKHFYHSLDKRVKSQHLYRHNLQVSTQ